MGNNKEGRNREGRDTPSRSPVRRARSALTAPMIRGRCADPKQIANNRTHVSRLDRSTRKMSSRHATIKRNKKKLVKQLLELRSIRLKCTNI